MVLIDHNIATLRRPIKANQQTVLSVLSYTAKKQSQCDRIVLLSQ
jgi:hypothetical protein